MRLAGRIAPGSGSGPFTGHTGAGLGAADFRAARGRVGAVLSRRARAESGRTMLGSVVVATSEGGVGTGHGRGGAIVAVVLGAIGALLAGLARAREGRSR